MRDTSIAVGLDADGVPATELVTGLGFVLSFGRASRLHLVCDGLLPRDGMHLDISDHGIDKQTAEILEHAVMRLPRCSPSSRTSTAVLGP